MPVLGKEFSLMPTCSVDRIEIGAGGCNHPIVDGCMISPIGHILQDVNNNS